jgi:transcription elongation factor Elf1
MSIITDTKYLSLLSPRLERFKKVRDYLWNFRCPQCGDSHKSKSKARGYVYRKKTDLFFKCHNCGVGQSVGNLIKDLDPFLHKQYIMERYRAGETGQRKSKAPEFKFETPKFKPKKTTIDLPSIESLPKEHYARVYCEGREIPQQFMDKIFYAEDFKNWALSVCQVDYSNLMGKEPRLVIPFFDRDNQLIGAQGRALQESKIRYVTVKVHEDAPKVFGLERWNSDQHTYLVEGPIDSLFLPNCLAMAGADMSDLSILNKDKTTLIFDNEPRNFQIVKSMVRFLKNGWKIVVWPNSITCKDINDMVLTSIKDARLVEIINTNTYSGQRGEWEVKSWKKV